MVTNIFSWKFPRCQGNFFFKCFFFLITIMFACFAYSQLAMGAFFHCFYFLMISFSFCLWFFILKNIGNVKQCHNMELTVTLPTKRDSIQKPGSGWQMTNFVFKKLPSISHHKYTISLCIIRSQCNGMESNGSFWLTSKIKYN